MTRSIIIIGAGIADLSAGCYGQMNGYTMQILESTTVPWRRMALSAQDLLPHRKTDRVTGDSRKL